VTLRPAAAGRRVLLTRVRGGSDRLRQILTARGLTVMEMPAIAIEPAEDLSLLDRALADLHSYQWVAFASRNAVRAVLNRLSALGLALPGGVRIAAVGASTAEDLRAAGIGVHCLPERQTAAGLAAAMQAVGVQGARILLPVGDRSRPELRERLEAAGARVESVVVYRTVLPQNVDADLLDAVRQGGIDTIVLASPSAAENLVALLGTAEPLARAKLVCIGPTTATAVRDLGLKPAAVAARPAPEALADAVLSLYGEHHHD
jgi:uroporphyrinogen III methyltransferase/synthase